MRSSGKWCEERQDPSDEDTAAEDPFATEALGQET